MSADLSPLPVAWKWIRLGDVASVIRNGISAKPDAEVGTPVLRISSVRPGRLEVNAVRYLSEDSPSLDQFAIECGDVLFTRYNGTRELVGVAAVVPKLSQRILHPDKLIKVRVPDGLYNSTIVALAANVGASREFINGRIRTTAGQAGISGGDLRELPLPLPPRAEQERIVSALDSYFTRLDSAIATLERVQRNLKRYRASVLKAAVEGRLVPTEADLARAEGRDYEPASKLLQRILVERRRRWEEAELAKMKAAGKVPKDDKWKAKYEEPAAPDTSDLPELPEGWCWASVDALALVKGGITKDQKRQSSSFREIPYLRVANVQRGYLDLREIATIRASEEDIDDLALQKGDVLFNEGGDRDKLGRGWIWNGELDLCIHQNHVFRARIYTDDFQPKLLSWYGNSSGQQYFFSEGKQTTNLASINSTKLKNLPVPIPPRAEQLRILAEVERLLSVIGESETLVDANLKRCHRLRQSILKWAFKGKLADQDPNDEPASVLLERIRAERAATQDDNQKTPRKTARPAKRS